MKNFPEFETESMGGCESFQFIPCRDTKSIATPDISNEIKTAIEPETNKTILSGLAITDTLEFTEDTETKNAGIVYKTKIAGIVPKLTSEYLSLFLEMTKKRHYIILKDNNANSRLVGYENGAIFSFKQKTDKSPAGTNGFSFEFNAESSKPTPFYVV